jgi:hypothetical protein
MKTLAAHGLAGGIVQDRMGGSFGAGFLSGSLGSYLGSSGHSKNMFEMIGNTAAIIIFAKNSLVPIAAITALVETAEIIPNITPKKFPVGSVYFSGLFTT